MSLECKIYQKELRVLGYGLPLYEPNPAEYDRVRVGDVGITEKNGYFRRIFNALPREDMSSDCDINSYYGLPDGFEPLPVACRPTTPSNEISPGSWLHSGHVKRIEGDVDFSVTAAPVGARVNFIVSNRQAAALRIKHSAERVNASRIALYREYMLKHYKSWARFFRELGFEFGLQDMILVTGHDLTANWATATLIESSMQGGIRFQAGDSATFSASTEISGVSESSVHVPIRIGPSPYTPPKHRTSDDVETFKDQCIFLRGFRVLERLFVPRVMRAAAEPKDLDMDRDLDANSGLLPVVYDSDEEEELEQEAADHKTILDAILRTDAEIAIVHENDICSLAKATGNDLKRLKTMSDFRESGFEIVTELDPNLQRIVGTIKRRSILRRRQASQEEPAEVNSGRENVDGHLAPPNIARADMNSDLDRNTGSDESIGHHPPRVVCFADDPYESDPENSFQSIEDEEPNYNANILGTNLSNDALDVFSKLRLTVEESFSDSHPYKRPNLHRTPSTTTLASDTTCVASDVGAERRRRLASYKTSKVKNKSRHRNYRLSKGRPLSSDSNLEELKGDIKELQSCILELRAEMIRLRSKLGSSRFAQ